MKYGLEQFVDSDLKQYFVGIVSEIDLHQTKSDEFDKFNRVSNGDFYCDLLDVGHLYIERPVGSKVINNFWSSHPYKFPDFPFQKIMMLSKDYIENIKEVNIMRKLWNFINAGEQRYRCKAFNQGLNHIKKLVDDYFEKNDDIKETELGYIKILGSDFLVNLVNLSELDHCERVCVGRLSPNFEYYEYDYDGPDRSYEINGKATGLLYKFNLRFILND